MLFSEYERKILAELDEQLSHDAPRLARLMRRGTSNGFPMGLVRGLLAAAPGMAVLFLGIYYQAVAIGVAGFGLMIIGVYWSSLRWPKSFHVPRRPAGNGNDMD